MSKNIVSKLMVHLILIAVVISMLMPFIWMILTSFKTTTEATQLDPFVLFPAQWRLDAYSEVMRNTNFPILYFNTFVLVAFRVICGLLFPRWRLMLLRAWSFLGETFCLDWYYSK